MYRDLRVLSEEYFIVFKLPCLPSTFLLVMDPTDVCVWGILCIYMWVVFFPLHVLVPWTYDPPSCGSDWSGLVFVLLKNRVVHRK